ncbi:MAG TPA: hypothetical protein DDZ80_05350 [Cyanobacteria bacterium UBA8803]|nr:hypothetical protein [Cyanobacteria bacterium UBA9273]HBL57970.1 hypothetical protein [Cyanobacteria bacterium UBA8803]
MHFNSLATIVGLTSAVVVSAQLSAVHATTANYQIGSGTTSLNLDLELLEDLGLSFNSASDTVTPANGFSFGFDMLPPSSTVLGTDFTFSYDDATDTFTPLGGTIEHSGSLLFDVDTDKLTLFPTLEIGNFSIGFDGGYFIRDTFSTGLRLFDLVINTKPVVAGKDLQISDIDLLIAPDFAGLLTNYDPDLSEQLVGTVIGQASIDAQTVPEPGSVLAILTTASAALALNRQKRKVS